MKKKEKTSLHTMKAEELAKLINETTRKLADWSLNRYSKQSKNVREPRGLRQKIAIAKTIQSMKEQTHE